MEIKSEFSKMQCLFTGNRFSGVNIVKTKISLNYELVSENEANYIVLFTSNISYLEVDDEVNYQQYAKVKLLRINFTKPLLFTIAKQLKQELIRRYETSNIYKFLELKGDEDGFKDSELSEVLSKMLEGYNNDLGKG